METDNIELYENIEFLKSTRPGGGNLASMEIKKEKMRRAKNGKLVREKVRKAGDLLVTLPKANTDSFSSISDEEINMKIVEMGVGRMKKAVTPQNHQQSNIPNGNKFFVLENVKKEDFANIPEAFYFLDPDLDQLRMWLNYAGKPRKCGFCSKYHDNENCPLEEKIRLLEKERDEVKQKNNNKLPFKTYTDSTLRLGQQLSLASDIDTMSGGSTGNILNAIDVDPHNRDTEYSYSSWSK